LGAAPEPHREHVRWLSSLDPSPSRAFFRELLNGKSTATPLPGAEPANKPLEARGYGTTLHVVPSQTLEAARALAEQTRTTLGTVVQAAWALVLSRFTAETDVVFGATRSGRYGSGGSEPNRVGLFINTLPVRADVSDAITVQQLLRALREQSLAVRSHEHLSLTALASELGTTSALFETLLMFDNRELNQVLCDQGGSQWLERRCTLHEQPPLPLNVTVFEGDVLELRLLYDQRRFRPSVVQRLAECIAQALQALSRAPDAPLGTLDVLPPAERQRLLVEFNDTSRAAPEDVCIHELFEAQVLRQPGHVAVEADGSTLTYEELELRANRLANLLRSRGAAPGKYVGICLRRGLELVVALIAVAKSGAAYVPLDPVYPVERLAVMVDSADVLVVVTEHELAGRFTRPTLVVDGEHWQELEQSSVLRAARTSSPTEACYAIFTSGSTGVPKGVVLSHRAVVNTLDWVNRTLRVGPTDRLLFVTSPCFDLSVYDVFGTLGAGGTVVVATESRLADPQSLARLIVEGKITIWDSAPAALQRLVPFFPEGPNADLRLVMLSGDWIGLSLPDAVRSAFPRAQVVSLGGATEAAIWSNWYPIGEVDSRWASIPYGKPIDNARYHVLDRRMQPVPIGVQGDLYIGGLCLAEGYLNQPQLTAERFLSDPFHPEKTERLYKTGDLARYFEDGNLEFLGRADFQVKIRGYRVEIGEVEAVLSELQGVRDAACNAIVDASGQKSLIGYVVREPGTVLEARSILDAVGKKLPHFMVPSQILFLDALPLSSNGKLDRKALPAPSANLSLDVTSESLTPTERKLAALWQELLGKSGIESTDNFFALGGHSLMAVMLVSRVKERLAVEIPLAEFLAAPTLGALSALVELRARNRARTKYLQSFNSSGERAPLILIPGVVGTAYTYSSLPDMLGPDQPIHVIDLLGNTDDETPYDSVEAMAELYEREILATVRRSSFVLGGFSFGALVAFELAHRLAARGRSVPLLISFDGFAPGYPPRLPMPERVLAHTRELLRRDNKNRALYLLERFQRLRDRFVHAEQPQQLAPEATHELSEHMSQVRERQVRAQHNYKPQYQENCGLLLIRAEETPNWIGSKMDDPLHGWRQYIRGPVSLITVPGSHLRIWDHENQPLIANTLVEHLARFVPGAPPSSLSRRLSSIPPPLA
jgi:amino acid adenylation domain-containing protein